MGYILNLLMNQNDPDFLEQAEAKSTTTDSLGIVSEERKSTLVRGTAVPN